VFHRAQTPARRRLRHPLSGGLSQRVLFFLATPFPTIHIKICIAQVQLAAPRLKLLLAYL